MNLIRGKTKSSALVLLMRLRYFLCVHVALWRVGSGIIALGAPGKTGRLRFRTILEQNILFQLWQIFTILGCLLFQIARADFTPLHSIRGVIWFPDFSQSVVDELCNGEDEVSVFVIAAADESKCGGATDQIVIPAGDGPVVKAIIRTSNSEVRIQVSLQTRSGANWHFLLDERFNSSLAPEMILNDKRMQELIMLMVADSLPVLMRSDGRDDQRLRLENSLKSMDFDVDFLTGSVSFDGSERLFRVDELTGGKEERGESGNTGGGSYLLQKTGRSGGLTAIRAELFQRLLALTRENSERGRASAVAVFVGFAPDFVDQSPKFILQSVVWVSLAPYLRFAFALDGIQNSVPIYTQFSEDEEAMSAEGEGEPIRRTSLTFDEVMLRPSVSLALPQEILGVELSLQLGYAFYLQKVRPVELNTNLFPNGISEVNDFAPAFGFGLTRAFGSYRSDLMGDYSQTVGTGRRFRRAMVGFNLSGKLSSLTMGVIDTLNGYVGLSARYLDHELELRFENSKVQGSLLSTVSTPAVGLFFEVFL